MDTTDVDIRWASIADRFAAAVETYYDDPPMSGPSTAADRTGRINSELVPKRGKQLLEWLNALTGSGQLMNLRVLEAGSGFGSLATYLAIYGEPAELVGIDVRQDFLDTARSCIAGTGLEEHLAFVRSDMRDLSRWSQGSFDLVLANNALLYVTEQGGVGQALSEFHRVLVPRGRVLIYQANRWRLDDPFTRDPVAHLLPRPLARGVSAVTGWQDDRNRAAPGSPPQLWRSLRRAGFLEVRVRAASTKRLRRILPVSNFLVASGRRP